MKAASASGTAYAVVDASVALKWVLDDEELIDQAIAIRDGAVEGDFRMIAPSHWVYEVTNGLVFALRGHRVDAAFADEALATFDDVGVWLVDPEPLHVLRTAVRLGITAYDAAYVALAEAVGCPCWTADRDLSEACSGRDDVRFLDQMSVDDGQG